MPTAKQADYCLVPYMEATCSLSKRRFPLLGTSGFATCSNGCRLDTKPSPCLDGRRLKEQFAIWANGIPTLKIILILLVSTDRNGPDFQCSVGISGRCLLLSSDEKLCMSNWCRVQAVVGCLPLWNSDKPNQRHPRLRQEGSITKGLKVFIL